MGVTPSEMNMLCYFELGRYSVVEGCCRPRQLEAWKASGNEIGDDWADSEESDESKCLLSSRGLKARIEAIDILPHDREKSVWLNSDTRVAIDCVW